MGHAHYWERPPTLRRPAFFSAVADCRHVCRHLSIPLGGPDGNGRPQFDLSRVCFNGKEHEGGPSPPAPAAHGPYEPFCVSRIHEVDTRRRGSSCFGSCKTERRAYDLCVRCCLIVLSHHLGPAVFRVYSDATPEEWDEARAACQRTLGYGGDWPGPEAGDDDESQADRRASPSQPPTT